jgi:hypothetical protein
MTAHSGDVDGVASRYIAELAHRPAWMRDALCLEYRHLNWIPTRGDGTFDTLRAICRSCLVTDQCLAYALDHPDVMGVWGGTTARERQRLRSGGRGPGGERTPAGS